MKTVIEMAREVKMPYDFVTGEPLYLEKLEAFAELVRAEALAEQPAQQCWKCGDMDAAFQAKCNVPACGMKEQPAQRTWVELTDGVISCLWLRTSPYFNEDDFARSIEKYLKEKNEMQLPSQQPIPLGAQPTAQHVRQGHSVQAEDTADLRPPEPRRKLGGVQSVQHSQPGASENQTRA